MSSIKRNIYRILALLMLFNTTLSAHSALALESQIDDDNQALSELLGEELTICTESGFEKISSAKYASLLESLYSDDGEKGLKDLSSGFTELENEYSYEESYTETGFRYSDAAYFDNSYSSTRTRAPPFIA